MILDTTSDSATDFLQGTTPLECNNRNSQNATRNPLQIRYATTPGHAPPPNAAGGKKQNAKTTPAGIVRARSNAKPRHHPSLSGTGSTNRTLFFGFAAGISITLLLCTTPVDAALSPSLAPLSSISLRSASSFSSVSS